ncbi:hypothetical protein [Pseudomonas frederiksbergensis]|uniref:Uncharacterized protein n=1 Tax=Pseudomonas frederiksbergensis TaxID=104087 RepID=A0A0B1YR83_9PSED|nr:hypothetical protein [Pseudomonas frederiksbergensis]KHK61179.1 hypothetical protein JZ00_30075 [Pseudomonas frederiksbergensis]
MESVKRFSVGFSNHSTAEAVFADDFDRVSAENLALQQRLTVQDQRVDELENLLEHAFGAIPSNDGWDQLCAKILAALQPTAEAVSHE